MGAARRSSCQTYPGERAKRPVTCPGRRRYGVDGPVREVVMGKGERAGKPAKRPATKDLKEKRQAKKDKKAGKKKPPILGG